MVNASKILTVSYGTFSCTLEGFDDPFSTMRSIAEYFRDLAADDRYFGAEPPTPDPEMLHKIAEREIQRRVEARVNDNEVVLRQIEDQATSADVTPPAPAPSAAVTDADAEAGKPAPAPADDAAAQTTPDTMPEASEASAAPAADAPAAGGAPEANRAGAALAATAGVAAFAAAAPETVAEKLARIRAAVNRSRQEPEPLVNEMSAAQPATFEPDPQVSDAPMAFKPATATGTGEAFKPITTLYNTDPIQLDEDAAEVDQEQELDITGFLETGDLSVDAPAPDEITTDAAQADASETGASETGAPEADQPLDEAAPEPQAQSDPDDAPDNSLDAVPDEVKLAAGEAQTDAPTEEAPEAISEDVLVAMGDGQVDDATDGTDDEESAETGAEAATPEELSNTASPNDTARDALPPSELEETADADSADADDDPLAAILAAEAEPDADDQPDDVLSDDLSAILNAVGLEPEAEATESDAPVAVDAELGTDKADTDEEDLDLSAILGDGLVDEAAETANDTATLADAAPLENGGGEATADASTPVEDPDLESILDPAPEPADTPQSMPPAQPRVRVMKMSRAEFDAEFEEVEPEDTPAAQTEPQQDEAGEIRETLGETGLSAEDEEELIRELLEVQQEPGTQTATSDDAAPEPAGETALDADEGPASLEPLVLTTPITQDAGAEPGASDAPAQEERADKDPNAIAEALEELVAAADRPDAARDLAATATDDASVDRLLAETDSALEDNSGTRRRSAIAHLKAAVAAVRADGNSGRDSKAAETARTMDRFRKDLAQVVRPETDSRAATDAPAEPEADGAVAPESEAPAQTSDTPVATRPSRPKTDGPVTERPRRAMPPLMLVSEQRVDAETTPTSAEPVRPRRVGAEDPDEAAPSTPAPGTTEDFRAFLAKTKAEGLQEELEASLAFGIYVEGAEYNSRPKIMTRVLKIYDDGSVTREDGLRAFGVLLREGRIHRVRRGEFLLAEESRFHPDANPQANSA